MSNNKKKSLKNDEQFQSFVNDLESKYNLQPGLLNTIFDIESNFNPDAVSPVGAKGIAQFMPGTAKDYGVDVKDPYSSAEGAAKYFRDLNKLHNGDTDKVLASYNWGQGNVLRKGLERMPKETRDYLAKAKRKMGETYGSFYAQNTEQIKTQPQIREQVTSQALMQPEPQVQPQDLPVTQSQALPSMELPSANSFNLPSFGGQEAIAMQQQIQNMRDMNEANATMNNMSMYGGQSPQIPMGNSYFQPAINPAQGISQVSNNPNKANAVQGIQVPVSQPIQTQVEQPVNDASFTEEDYQEYLKSMEQPQDDASFTEEDYQEYLKSIEQPKVEEKPKRKSSSEVADELLKIASAEKVDQKALNNKMLEVYKTKSDDEKYYNAVIAQLNAKGKNKEQGFLSKLAGGVGRGVVDTAQGVRQLENKLTGGLVAKDEQDRIDIEAMRRDVNDYNDSTTDEVTRTVGNVVGGLIADTALAAASAPVALAAKGAGVVNKVGKFIDKGSDLVKNSGAAKYAKDIASNWNKLDKNGNITDKVSKIANSKVGKGAVIGGVSSLTEAKTSDEIKKDGGFIQSKAKDFAEGAAVGGALGGFVTAYRKFKDKVNLPKDIEDVVSKANKEFVEFSNKNGIPLSVVDKVDLSVEDLKKALPGKSQKEIDKIHSKYLNINKKYKQAYERVTTKGDTEYLTGEKRQEEAINSFINKNTKSSKGFKDDLSNEISRIAKVDVVGNRLKDLNNVKDKLKNTQDGDYAEAIKLKAELKHIEDKAKSDIKYQNVEEELSKYKFKLNDIENDFSQKALNDIKSDLSKSVSETTSFKLKTLEDMYNKFNEMKKNGRVDLSNYKKVISDFNNEASSLKIDGKNNLARSFETMAKAIEKDLDTFINSLTDKNPLKKQYQKSKEANKYYAEEIVDPRYTTINNLINDAKNNGRENNSNTVVGSLISNPAFRRDVVDYLGKDGEKYLENAVSQEIRNKFIDKKKIDFDGLIDFVNKKDKGTDVYSLKSIVGEERFKNLQLLTKHLNNYQQYATNKNVNRDQVQSRVDTGKITHNDIKEFFTKALFSPLTYTANSFNKVFKGFVDDKVVSKSFNDKELSDKLRKIEKLDPEGELFKKKMGALIKEYAVYGAPSKYKQEEKD